MVLASFFFACMSTFIYAAHQRDEALSTLVSSFVRIAVNFLCLVLPFLWLRKIKSLIGDGRASLWARGLFGTGSLMCTFVAIKAIGAGEASFIFTSNGIFIAALSPYFLGQKNTPKVWVAIIGSIVGLALLLEPRMVDLHAYGRWVALFAGFCGAMAYMMISKAGTSNSTSTVIFYFCLVGVLIHLAALLVHPVVWPEDPVIWMYLVCAGLTATIAQFFLTAAYQYAPAAEVTAVGYVNPVFQMVGSAIVFGLIPDGKAMVGAAIVLVFGVALPFMKLPKHPRLRSKFSLFDEHRNSRQTLKKLS